MPIVPMATSARALFAISALLPVLPQDSFQNELPNQEGAWSCRYVENYKPLLVDHFDDARKQNFFHKLKDVLIKTKQDIKGLLRKRREKNILKKQQSDELARINSLKFEEVMQKWQTKFNVVRRKRSANEFQNFFNRIKNIIPGYLRGKVKPAVDKKNANASRNGKRHGHKTRKPHRKHTKFKTTTVHTKS